MFTTRTIQRQFIPGIPHEVLIPAPDTTIMFFEVSIYSHRAIISFSLMDGQSKLKSDATMMECVSSSFESSRLLLCLLLLLVLFEARDVLRFIFLKHSPARVYLKKMDSPVFEKLKMGNKI